jgi:hypothetical protein
VSSTTRKESSGKTEVKEFNVECDNDENFKVDKEFLAQFFLLLCSDSG